MKNMTKKKRIIIISGIVLAVIVACVAIFTWKPSESVSCPADKEDKSGTEESGDVLERVRREAENKVMYEKIYNHMKEYQPEYITDGTGCIEIYEDIPAEEEAAEVPATESPAAEVPAAEAPVTEDVAEAVPDFESDMMVNGEVEYGMTNIQVEFIDEGDIVKNDGRYLYQLLRGENYEYSTVQIIDTQDGLKELSRIDGFSNIKEFYVWNDTVAVIESLWIDVPFNKVHFYDISDRTEPKVIHTFTLKGNYKTSRIADGYLYFFSSYNINETVKKNDLKSYIPVVEDEVLESDCLYLPEEITSTSYLLMVSVDLSEPTEFTDKMAVVSSSNYYYVSADNIYVLEDIYADYVHEGLQCDKTKIVRFPYAHGQIDTGIEGSVDGLLLDQFAMDEYDGYFRMITTVNPVKLEAVVDDFSGELLGYYDYEYLPESNSVYVLDDELNVIGSIENLAEEERVYSARFMGDIGYFVTFEEMDPLFSVDFSDPTKPKILGELKITGFSEYLHFYGENQLVGIGYEVNPENGFYEGIKISMFDISNPADVKEINKLVLKDYSYSDAFYNHHSVLISANKNLIGFLSEGYSSDFLRDYGVYSYDEETGFEQRFLFDCVPDEYGYFDVRGTYINDVFYLLKQNGGVEAYNLNSEKQIDFLENVVRLP